MRKVYHTIVQLPLFPSKICTACQTEKFLDEFPIARDKKDGHKSRCKPCTKEQEAAGYRAHTERYTARSQRYKANNPEKVKQTRRNHHIAHREYDNKHNVAYQKAHREETNERAYKWRKAHPEYVRQWQQSNPHKVLAGTMRYNARKRKATIGEVDYERILECNGNICHICNQSIDITLKHGPGKLHFDHVVPLTPRPGNPQGTHTEKNIHPSHAICNTRKSNKRLEDMTPHQRRGPDT